MQTLVEEGPRGRYGLHGMRGAGQALGGCGGCRMGCVLCGGRVWPTCRQTPSLMRVPEMLLDSGSFDHQKHRERRRRGVVHS